MTLNWTKSVLFSHKSVILGLILVFLALALSCGFVPTRDHAASADGLECNRSVQLVNYIPTKDGLFLSILFLSLIGLALLIKQATIDSRHNSIADLRFSPIPIKEYQYFAKLHNPILEALRRGVLNPQIYDLAVATR